MREIKIILKTARRCLRDLKKFFNKHPAVLILLIIFGMFLVFFGLLEIYPERTLLASLLVVVFCVFAVIFDKNIKEKALKYAFVFLIAFIEVITLALIYYISSPLGSKSLI